MTVIALPSLLVKVNALPSALLVPTVSSDAADEDADEDDEDVADDEAAEEADDDDADDDAADADDADADADEAADDEAWPDPHAESPKRTAMANTETIEVSLARFMYLPLQYAVLLCKLA